MFRFCLIFLSIQMCFFLSMPVNAFKKENIDNDRFEWDLGDVHTIWDWRNRGTLVVKSQLLKGDRKQLKRLPIGTIVVKKNADPGLFGKPIFFKRVKAIQFIDSLNAEHLEKIAANYNGVRKIYVEQERPITLSNTMNFKNLTELNDLAIKCKIKLNLSSDDILPENLKTLALSGSGMCENPKLNDVIHLPQLLVIRLNNETVDGFFGKLEVPKARTIYINNSKIAKGTIGELGKLKRLEWLILDNSTVNASDLRKVLEIESLKKIWIRNTKIVGENSNSVVSELQKKITVVM